MPHPIASSAYGIWSLNEVRDAVRGDNWPTVAAASTDVSLLINADGLADGSTAIVDASSNNNSIDVGGTAQVDTSVVKYGSGSIKFDDSASTRLKIPWSDSLFDFGTGNSTIEFWAYHLAGAQTILSWGEDASNRIDIGFYSANNLRYLIEFNGTIDRHESNVTLADVQDRWAHFAFVRDGDTIRIFVDGVQEYTGSWTLAQPIGSSSDVIIGRRSFGVSFGADPFNGYIDDLRITKGIARYTANFTPPSKLPTS